MPLFLMCVAFVVGSSDHAFGKHIGGENAYNEGAVAPSEIHNAAVTNARDEYLEAIKAHMIKNEMELTKKILDGYLEKCKNVKTPVQLQRRRKVVEKILTKLNHPKTMKSGSSSPVSVVSEHVAEVLRDIAYEISRQEQCLQMRNKDIHLLRKLEKKIKSHEAKFGTQTQLATTTMVLGNILKFMKSYSLSICDTPKPTKAIKEVLGKSTANKHTSTSSTTALPSGAGKHPITTTTKEKKPTHVTALTTKVKSAARKENPLKSTASTQSPKAATSKHKSTAGPSKISLTTEKHKASSTKHPPNSKTIVSAIHHSHTSLNSSVKHTSTKKPSISTTSKHKFTTGPLKSFPSPTKHKTVTVVHPSIASIKRPTFSHAAAFSSSVKLSATSPDEKLPKSGKRKSLKVSTKSSLTTTSKHKSPIGSSKISSTAIKQPSTTIKKSTSHTTELVPSIKASKDPTNWKSTAIAARKPTASTGSSRNTTSKHSVYPTTRKQLTSPHKEDEWKKLSDLMKAGFPDFFPGLLDKTIQNLKVYYETNHLKRVPFYRLAKSIISQFETLGKLLSSHILKNV